MRSAFDAVIAWSSMALEMASSAAMSSPSLSAPVNWEKRSSAIGSIVLKTDDGGKGGE